MENMESVNNTRNLAKKLKALASPERLDALCALLEVREEDDLYLDAFVERIGQDQSVVSRCLAEWTEYGFVDYRRYRGRKRYYYANLEKIKEVLDDVKALLEQHKRC